MLVYAKPNVCARTKIGFTRDALMCNNSAKRISHNSAHRFGIAQAEASGIVECGYTEGVVSGCRN